MYLPCVFIFYRGYDLRVVKRVIIKNTITKLTFLEPVIDRKDGFPDWSEMS